MQARRWLAENARPKAAASSRWGEGPDGVAVFHDLPADEERALIARLAAWESGKYDAGFGTLTWPEEYGGRGLDSVYDDVFAEEQEQFGTPEPHECPHRTSTFRILCASARSAPAGRSR